MNHTKRQPVVAVMGHIDHGKSTLLDYIRKTNTTAKEAGGITQHISAYEAKHKDITITFLDTPGHAAFKGIRTRGANVADIAILVVSAEEGVKPQTLEALQCIKQAGIPYIVAINKIDSEKANIERTKQSLVENEIYIEGYGGDISFVAISAKTGKGIEELLDLIALLSEVIEIKGDPHCQADGIILESKLDPKKGVSATLIIKNGFIRKGNFIVSGTSIAPVRLMENYLGKSLEEGGMGMPVLLIGFNSLPPIGEIFKAYATKKEAEQAVREVMKEATLTAAASVNDAKNAAKKHTKTPPDQIKKNEPGQTGQDTDPEIKMGHLPLIIKADNASSMEAIKSELNKLLQDKVKIDIISSGIGDVTENDMRYAISFQNSTDRIEVIGFGVKLTNEARAISERLGTKFHDFDIIYNLIEWVENELKLRTPKIKVEVVTGSAKILKIFSINKDKQVVGGKVLDGEIYQGAEVRIMRRENKIAEGRIRELQQQKTRTDSAKKDTEFGALIESSIAIAVGDKIETIKYESR